MTVADHCGLADPEGTPMQAAREGWIRWCREAPSLAVVDDLLDLSEWTRTATPDARAAVFAAVAARTKTDQAAIATLVWLLIPGAGAIAEQLHDLSPDIDALVAGQVWIEVASAWRLNGRAIARTILLRTRREICAELGVGDGAQRRDRAWAMSVHVERFDETVAAGSGEAEDDPFWQVTELLMDAMDDNVVGVFDAWLIGELARVAYASGAPGHRGRVGLTTPSVVEIAAQHVHLSTRGLRRRAVKAVDRIAEYLHVREDPARFAVWRARHPAGSLTARDEMQLVIAEDESAYWVRARSRAADASVRDPALGPRRSSSA